MIEPGQVCPTCEQRVSFPAKPTSPPTKKMAYWVPADEKKAHDETLVATAKFLGTYERPHWEFWTVTFALAAVLQDESLKGAGQRSEVVA